jgi:hypothetical protein
MARVMICDDDKALAHELLMALRAARHEATTCHHTMDVLREATEGRFDLVIFGLDMTGFGGRRMCRSSDCTNVPRRLSDRPRTPVSRRYCLGPSRSTPSCTPSRAPSKSARALHRRKPSNIPTHPFALFHRGNFLRRRR